MDRRTRLFSYGQQMTVSYKGYKLFDSGWWSRTTAKHQSDIRNYYLSSTKRIDLKYANFNKSAEYSINQEIEHAEYEIKERETKRKTKKNLETIDELIEVLKHYKKEMGGDTKVYLSDFEFNGKQTQFEISKVDEEKELFLFYEMHESLW